MSDRLLREVTREEWRDLPLERSYYKADEDMNPHFYEIVDQGV